MFDIKLAQLLNKGTHTIDREILELVSTTHPYKLEGATNACRDASEGSRAMPLFRTTYQRFVWNYQILNPVDKSVIIGTSESGFQAKEFAAEALLFLTTIWTCGATKADMVMAKRALQDMPVMS